MNNIRSIICIAAPLILAGGLMGCEQEGPMERMGEKLDKSIEQAGDALERDGPIEKAGEQIDRSLDKVGRELNKVGQDLERAVNG